MRTADPLTHCIETAVQVLADKGCSRAEQAKAVVLMTCATSVDVAKAGTQCFRDAASLETATFASIRKTCISLALIAFSGESCVQ